MAAVLHGIADVGMVSRELSQRERDHAASKNIELGTFPLARDGVTVIVNRANPVASLNLDQVVFAGRIRNWRDLGGGMNRLPCLSAPPVRGLHRCSTSASSPGTPMRARARAAHERRHERRRRHQHPCCRHCSRSFFSPGRVSRKAARAPRPRRIVVGFHPVWKDAMQKYVGNNDP
jgi:hypothetical protein